MNQENFSAICFIVFACAEKFQWGDVKNYGNSACAIKKFETIVGLKEANLLLIKSGSVVLIQPNYVSEGRNILECEFFAMSFSEAGLDIDRLRELFVNVDILVNQSYARKLFLNNK